MLTEKKLELKRIVISPDLTIISIYINGRHIDDAILNDDRSIDYEALCTGLMRFDCLISAFAKSDKDYIVHRIRLI